MYAATCNLCSQVTFFHVYPEGTCCPCVVWLTWHGAADIACGVADIACGAADMARGAGNSTCVQLTRHVVQPH